MSNIRLNSELRWQFISAVVKGIQRKPVKVRVHGNTWESIIPTHQALMDVLEMRVKRMLPEDVIAFDKKYPGALSMESVSWRELSRNGDNGIPWEANPHNVHTLWTEGKLGTEKMNRYGDAQVYVPRIALRGLVDKAKEASGDLLKLARGYEAETAAINARLSQLIRITLATPTLEGLRKALPDLVSYMPMPPAPAATTALAPVDLIPDLKALGLKVPAEAVAEAA